MESEQSELFSVERDGRHGVERRQHGPDGGQTGGEEDGEHGHLHQVEDTGGHGGWLGGDGLEQEHMIGVIQTQESQQQLDASSLATVLGSTQEISSLQCFV